MGEAGDKKSNTVVPVARILKLFAVAARVPEHRDEKLHDAILEVLGEVGADAVVFRVGQCGQAMGTFQPDDRWDRARKDQFIKIVAELARWQRRKGCISEPFREDDGGDEYLFNFPYYQQSELPDTDDNDFTFFCFVSGLRKREGKSIHRRRWSQIVNWISPEDNGTNPRGHIDGQYREVVYAYCAAIEMAMVRRIEADSVIPPKISGKFWNEWDDLAANTRCIRPWERLPHASACPIATASLSFDLRSSTFVMEHAIDKALHAAWLENLTKVLRTLAHNRDGVFDKFTGDGVLVHFPVYGFEVDDESTRCKIVCNCVASAWDMVLAAEYCAEYMKPNLTLETDAFGAAAGVAFDMAAWSHDEAGNPIVVGPGVVHACRLSADRDDNGVVLVTNAAFRRLVSRWGHQPDAARVPLVTKECSKDHKVTKVRMSKPPVGGDFNPGAIRDVVRKIFAGAK